MKRISALIILLYSLHISISAQGTWTATSAPPVSDRFDDIYFLNPDTGFAVSLDYDAGQHGQILRTTNGGATWSPTNARTTSEYRDIAFLNNQYGFVGTLQSSFSTPSDTVIMYKTIDGGLNWSPVTNLPGPSRNGICGMRAINDSTLYACGRFSGPPAFYKTTNRGASWRYIKLDSLAGGLVDAYFFGKDTGYIVGASDTGWIRGRGVILGTTDGGDHWRRIHVTDRDSQMCWKMSFPSQLIGYATIESFKYGIDSQFFAKTIDGGQTWQEHFLVKTPGYYGPGGFDQEGVGFINDTIGWIGGRDTSRTGKEYKTTNGGATWTVEHWGKNLNRFRNVGNGTAYFSGKTVYKFQCSSNSLTDTAIVCPGQSYTYSGQTFFQPGDFTITNQNTLCDAHTYLHLSNHAVQIPSVTDSAGSLFTGHFTSYQWYFYGVRMDGDTLSSLPDTAHGNGSYYVEVTDSNHCHTASANITVAHVGISEILDAALMLYPDPASSSLTVAGLADKTPIIITDMLGRTLLTDVANGARKTLNISALPSGIYFCNHRRFVKQ